MAEPVPPRMDIAPRDAPARRPGGIVSSLRRWNPTKTPKTTVTLALYLFGLFVAFVARPPVTITDQMQTRYFEMMDAAGGGRAAPRGRVHGSSPRGDLGLALQLRAQS